MTMAEFCRRFGIDYEIMRSRVRGGRDLFAPVGTTPAKTSPASGYTLSELSNLYSLFRDDEFALDILADFAGLQRGSSAVVKLERKILKYLEKLRKEVHGK